MGRAGRDARAGYLLLSPAEYQDGHFMGEFADVIEAFQQNSRCVYDVMIEEQSIHQGESSAPNV